MGVKLIYTDLAPGAAEDAEVTSQYPVETFCNPSRLPFGGDGTAIATLEPGGWGLSNEYHARQNHQIAFWSQSRSDAWCEFTYNAPTIMVAFDSQYSTSGITIRFSPASGDYCTSVKVTWYNGTTALDEGNFYPDAAEYVINNAVEGFNKIVIAFNRTNLPRKRVKVERIDFGVVRTFEGDELTEVKTIHEVDLISETVPYNVLDASFIGRDMVDYVFQRKQPVEAYNGDDLIGVYYVVDGKRVGATAHTMSCEDIIGTLELSKTTGGLWLEDTELTTILSSVFGTLSIFDIDQALSGTTLRGYLEPGITLREALQKILFPIGAVCDTTGSDKIRIFPVPSGNGTTISNRVTYNGGSVDTADTVTAVTVTGKEVLDEEPGSDDEYIEWEGEQYKVSPSVVTVNNPSSVVGDIPNEREYSSYFLTEDTTATRAAAIMAHLRKRKKYSFKHVIDGEEVGDRATASLPWGTGTTNGNIVKMSVSYTGLVVSDTEMIMD